MTIFEQNEFGEMSSNSGRTSSRSIRVNAFFNARNHLFHPQTRLSTDGGAPCRPSRVSSHTPSVLICCIRLLYDWSFRLRHHIAYICLSLLFFYCYYYYSVWVICISYYWIPRDSKSPHISKILLNTLVHLLNAVVWMFSILSRIFNSTSFFFRSLYRQFQGHKLQLVSPSSLWSNYFVLWQDSSIYQSFRFILFSLCGLPEQ